VTAAALLAAPLGFGYTEDRGFSATPTRVVNSISLNSSVDDQGGGNGYTRENTVLNAGSRGWFTEYASGTPQFDEEIVTTGARTGDQALRIGNWYSTGIINAMASPWLRNPAGETGSKDGGGKTATSTTFHTGFWFKTLAAAAPAAGQETLMSMSPDDGSGSRWGGYLQLRDRYDTGGGVYAPVLRTYNMPSATTSGYAYSPALQYGQWYSLDWNVVFNDGNYHTGGTTANDVVTLVLRDSGGNLIWQADQTTTYPDETNPNITLTGITTWEMATWYSGASAINSLQLRMSVPGGGTYSALRPYGFLFDDFQMDIGAGLNYFTSFEVPEPAMAGLLCAGVLLVLRRRRN